MSDPIEIDASRRQFESWRGVAIIAEALGSSGWALAGGQMVALHLLIAEIPFPRVTIDADTIVDVRARPDAARIAAAALVNSGWTASGVDNIIHRFTSDGGGVVDILGPDGLRKGPTTVPPATTLLAPGGTQLLNRSAEVVLRIIGTGETIHDLRVPLPSRLAAFIGKSAALGLPEGRDRHLLDAIHLAATLRPADLEESLSKADRRWIRRLIELAQDERAWVDVEENVRVLARATLGRLASFVN